MKVLHITPHLGGGVGTVIIDWMKKIEGKDHAVMCLDTMNDKGRDALESLNMAYNWNQIHALDALKWLMAESDIVLVHYWDHPMLATLFSSPIPDCRLVFWYHKNIPYLPEQILFPGRWIDTSPIQGNEYIWSTGNMDRFLAIEPKPHEGFNIGYVGTVDYKKMHPATIPMCKEILKRIPMTRFTFVGENNITMGMNYPNFHFTGKVNDVAPYLAEMDVFAYPLRPDHYGTCEIALGEAMSAGVAPVVMDNPAERLICGPGAKDEAEFIRTIEILHELPEFRKELSAMARNNARKRYSIDNMIASWDKMFEEMMREP